MKIASIINAIEGHNQSQAIPFIRRILVHTGQHYDEQMSNAFFRDLGIPKPDVDLEVGSGSHAQQTAEIMKRFEGTLLKETPDLLLVVGDVNSTAACSLVAAKIAYPPPSERTRPLIAHVEAGLRSFDRSMPEEVNRLVTDVLADFLFITEESAAHNLKNEGVPESKIHWVGNTMVDTLLSHQAKAEESAILDKLGLRRSSCRAGVRPYALVTLHRPSNVDNPKTFGGILEALALLARKLPILFPVHPRTAHRIREFALESSVRLAEEICLWIFKALRSIVSRHSGISISFALRHTPVSFDRLRRSAGGNDRFECPMCHTARKYRKTGYRQRRNECLSRDAKGRHLASGRREVTRVAKERRSEVLGWPGWHADHRSPCHVKQVIFLPANEKSGKRVGALSAKRQRRSIDGLFDDLTFEEARWFRKCCKPVRSPGWAGRFG